MKTMKIYLSSIFSLILITWSAQAIAQEGAPKLSPKEFNEMGHKGKKSVILDIRTPEEIAEGYIEDAIFVNWTGGNFEEEVSKLNKKKTYYVYCRSARRTIPATEKMKELGFKKVYMLDGGINNWIEAGMPVVKPEK
ncbi:rhodanese-like domain-containing protein [Mariniradius sediminis]|uniref:Rhodanese-like domain-containing protein n=1 Tax=Mariniradius sediminis TaxID=2909237 RepID=A0ABS9BU36_9BACT|nr:rhodanese-like domain-containing protein [Mariniradius sediminis]MCF1750860.1 rhodanese-like domain-containing protein [Mariniradius sediminis]